MITSNKWEAQIFRMTCFAHHTRETHRKLTYRISSHMLFVVWMQDTTVIDHVHFHRREAWNHARNPIRLVFA